MNKIINMIIQFSISDILLIFGAIVATVLYVEKIIKWILNKLNLFHKKKSSEEKILGTIIDHSNHLSQVSNQLQQFGVILENNNEITKRMLRHTITKSCEEYLKRGSIETYELQALEDLFDVYENILNGNSFVHTLIKKVGKLSVINKYANDEE